MAIEAGQITVDVVPRFVHNATSCDHGADCLDCTPIFATLILNAQLETNERLDRVEKQLMTEVTAQSHLDADVTGLKSAFAALVAEWQSQHAAGQPINFAAADQLLSDVNTEVASEQIADAPPAPVSDPEPQPVDGDGSPIPAPVDTDPTDSGDVPDPAPSTDNVVIGAPDDSTPTA